MSKKVKTQKNFLYEGLGFPVILGDVAMVNVFGEWEAHINVEKVAKMAFSMLPHKPSKFTGNEIYFIRTHLKLNRREFGELFKVSHTAVSKWEKSGNKASSISAGNELMLRLHILDQLAPSGAKFYNSYKEISESVYDEETSEVPLKIAV